MLTYHTGNLMLQDQKLRELGQPSKNDFRSVYHWIMTRKPVGAGQYDWIYHVNDFVPLSKVDRFESSILSSHLKVRTTSTSITIYMILTLTVGTVLSR
jgi:hypothetical protein